MLELSKTVGQPAGVTENCFVWEKPTHTVVTRNVRREVFCVGSKGDTLGKDTLGKDCVPT